jgi:hypothetical protein
LVFLLIIVFFFLFGCPYEFVKCYLEKKFEEDDEDKSVDYDEDIQTEVEPVNEEMTCKKWTICILLAFLGLLCQPLYLVFYMMYGLMECYRQFGCWMFMAAGGYS